MGLDGTRTRLVLLVCTHSCRCCRGFHHQYDERLLSSNSILLSQSSISIRKGTGRSMNGTIIQICDYSLVDVVISDEILIRIIRTIWGEREVSKNERSIECIPNAHGKCLIHCNLSCVKKAEGSEEDTHRLSNDE